MNGPNLEVMGHTNGFVGIHVGNLHLAISAGTHPMGREALSWGSHHTNRKFWFGIRVIDRYRLNFDIWFKFGTWRRDRLVMPVLCMRLCNADRKHLLDILLLEIVDVGLLCIGHCGHFLGIVKFFQWCIILKESRYLPAMVWNLKSTSTHKLLHFAEYSC